MELSKIKLHSCRQKENAKIQVTVDDDYNVPDYRPDILKVVKESGEVKIDEAKPESGSVWAKGRMIFKILYRSDQENGKMCCLKGEIPFQEKLNMDDVTEYDTVRVTGELEDLSIGVIHSRKLNIRAVLSISAEKRVTGDTELTVDVADGESCERKLSEKKTMQILFMNRDLCRQKNEVALPSSKPNVQEIVWKSMELRNVSSVLDADGIRLNGEILVSVLYNEEETDRIQWFETVVPLDCRVECEAGAYAKMPEVFYKIELLPVSKELDVKPDYDGEERMLVMEMVLSLDIRVWKEESVQFLEDVYALDRELVLKTQELSLKKILTKNDSQCRLVEKMELPDNKEHILQICSCEGKAKIEHLEQEGDQIRAEGILAVELMYITTDDHIPIGVYREIYPFEQMIEIPEEKGELQMEIECDVNQLQAVMLDQEHVEIKAVISLDFLAFSEEKLENIVAVEEDDYDTSELSKRPGLIGYIVKDGDCLWKIAKENHTTVQEVMRTNQKKEEQLKPGEKLLIVKSVS